MFDFFAMEKAAPLPYVHCVQVRVNADWERGPFRNLF
jgi:hypothetical protein